MTSKLFGTGQITIKEDIRRLLNMGDDCKHVIFVYDRDTSNVLLLKPEDSISLKVKNTSNTMAFDCPLTVKFQTSIPLFIRKTLGLKTGDSIDFVMEGDTIYVRKSDFICPVCKGTKKLLGYDCIVCNDGVIQDSKSALLDLYARVLRLGRKYNVMGTILSSYMGDKEEVEYYPIPKISLTAHPDCAFSQEYLDTIRDYYQFRLVQEVFEFEDGELPEISLQELIDIMVTNHYQYMIKTEFEKVVLK